MKALIQLNIPARVPYDWTQYPEIFDGFDFNDNISIAQFSEKTFDVAEGLVWVDAPDSFTEGQCTDGYYYKNGEFLKYPDCPVKIPDASPVNSVILPAPDFTK